MGTKYEHSSGGALYSIEIHEDGGWCALRKRGAVTDDPPLARARTPEGVLAALETKGHVASERLPGRLELWHAVYDA